MLLEFYQLDIYSVTRQFAVVEDSVDQPTIQESDLFPCIFAVTPNFVRRGEVNTVTSFVNLFTKPTGVLELRSYSVILILFD